MRISKPIVTLGESVPVIADIMPFLYAGKAELMFTDIKTFDSFTIQCSKPARIIFIRLRISTGRHMKTVYMGCIQSWGTYYPNKNLNKRYTLISDVLADSIRSRSIPDNFIVTHKGGCARCGKPLKTADSYLKGIGPECKIINKKENLSTGFYFE